MVERQGFFFAQVAGQRPAWLADISREIEIMRHVIVQENARLRDSYNIEKEACSKLRAELVRSAVADFRALAIEPSTRPNAEDGSGSLPSGLRPHRTVEWRILGVASNASACTRSVFEFPEYPGVRFSISYGARKPQSVASMPSIESSCHLRLRVLGPSCSDTCFRIGLDARLDVSNGAAADLPSPPSSAAKGCNSDSVGSMCSLGRKEEALVKGGGCVSCPCRWPPSGDADVVCRARITLIGLQSD